MKNNEKSENEESPPITEKCKPTPRTNNNDWVNLYFSGGISLKNSWLR